MNNSKISKQIQILFNQFKVKNFEYVISKTKQLIKHHPEYVILYNLLGVAYQNIGEFNKAKENFIEGLKRDINNLAMMNNLAMSYKNLLKYDEAENLYVKIIKQKDMPGHLGWKHKRHWILGKKINQNTKIEDINFYAIKSDFGVEIVDQNNNSKLNNKMELTVITNKNISQMRDISNYLIQDAKKSVKLP